MNDLTPTQLTIELLACSKRCGNCVLEALALPQLASLAGALALEMLRSSYQPGSHSRFQYTNPSCAKSSPPASAPPLV